MVSAKEELQRQMDEEIIEDADLEGMLEDLDIHKDTRKKVNAKIKNTMDYLKGRFPKGECLGKTFRVGRFVITCSETEEKAISFQTSPSYQVKVKSTKE